MKDQAGKSVTMMNFGRLLLTNTKSLPIYQCNFPSKPITKIGIKSMNLGAFILVCLKMVIMELPSLLENLEK